MRKRFIYFGDGFSNLSAILYKSFVKASKTLDIDIVAVVDTNPLTKRGKNILRLQKSVKNIFDNNSRDLPYTKTPFYLYDAHNIRSIISSNINSNDFIRMISVLNPDYAIVVDSHQTLKSPLVQCFHKVINYHPSLLPDYDGIDSIQWAMYNREKYTGFTFHFVNNDNHLGNILLQDRFKIDYRKPATEVKFDLSTYAANRMYHMLQLLFLKFDGYETENITTTYDRSMRDQLLFMGNLSRAEIVDRLIEIQNKMSIWGYVQLQYKGSIVNVTRIDSNGIIRRINNLPPFLYNSITKTYRTSSIHSNSFAFRTFL